MATKSHMFVLLQVQPTTNNQPLLPLGVLKNITSTYKPLQSGPNRQFGLVFISFGFGSIFENGGTISN